MVECKICGEKFKQLGSHLRSKHGINSKVYTSMFPGSATTCDETRAKVVERNIGNQHGLGNRWSEERRSKISSSMKGNQRGLGLGTVAIKSTEIYRELFC